MESTELRIFKEVANTKSISKAAIHLGYVQSNITAHIKKLEDELQTTLFIRHNKGVTLTKKGKELLSYAENIIALLDEATKSITTPQITLTIGTTQTIAGFFLPRFLAVYQKQNSHISITVKILSHEDMERNLLSKDIDCIITNTNALFTHAKEVMQIPEKLCIITPMTCDNLDMIDSYSLITNTLASCPYRNILIDYIHTRTTTPPLIYEFDSVEAILHAVSLGMGISLLPETVVKNNPSFHTFHVQDLPTTTIRFYTLDEAISEKVHTLFTCIEKKIA